MIDVIEKVRLGTFEKLYFVIIALVLIASVLGIYCIRTAKPEGISNLSVSGGDIYDLSVINQATYEDFMAVQGIGEKKASAIISLRNSIGGFTDINQITYLDGISDVLLERIIEHFYGEQDSNGNVSDNSPD